MSQYKDLRLIHQICMVAVTWHHLRWTILVNILMPIKDILVPDELVNVLTQHGFHFDSPNVQDSWSMALSGMVLHFGHIGQTFCYR